MESDVVPTDEHVTVKRETDGQGTEVAYIKGGTFEQVQVSQAADNPDPRVGGSRIIFDSRLDKFTTQQ